MSTNRPEAFPDAFRIQSGRAADEGKIFFILKQEEFGLVPEGVWPAHPIRNCAVDDGQPELFVGTSLILINKVAQNSLLIAIKFRALIFAGERDGLNGSVALLGRVRGV